MMPIGEFVIGQKQKNFWNTAGNEGCYLGNLAL